MRKIYLAAGLIKQNTNTLRNGNAQRDLFAVHFSF